MDHFTAHLHDEAGTIALGVALARALAPGLVIYLHGDLGAGKSTLTRAMLHAAGHVGTVKSPTYTLAEPYRIRLAGQALELIHYDLYRMASPEEFLDAGFRDDFNGVNVCVVEWPEKGQPVLPAPDLTICLHISGHGRDVECKGITALGQTCLQRLNFAPNL